MKLLKKVTVITFAVLLLTMPVAYALEAANPNVSELEETFLAFEKALVKKLVADGYVTQQEADAEIDMLQQLLEESDEDFVYKLLIEGVLPFFEPLDGQAWKAKVLR